MTQDNIKVTGNVKAILYDANMNIKETHEFSNLVVTVGKTWIASRMAGGGTPMTYMAIGTNNTTAVVGNTGLGTELVRIALTTPGGTPGTANITFNATYAPGTGTGSLYEAGIFNASSSGTMLARVVFGVINKAAADTLAITWVLTFN